MSMLLSCTFVFQYQMIFRLFISIALRSTIHFTVIQMFWQLNVTCILEIKFNLFKCR